MLVVYKTDSLTADVLILNLQKCCHQGSNLAQICTKLSGGWGFAPDPTEELRALPNPLAGKGEGGEGEGSEERMPPVKFKSGGYTPLVCV